MIGEFAPDPIHAGRLRYPGMSPLLSHMYELGLFEAVAMGPAERFETTVRFTGTERGVPAPESAHALWCGEAGEPKVPPTALCGHGHFDLNACDRYLSGRMKDFAPPRDRIEAAAAGLTCRQASPPTGRAARGREGAGIRRIPSSETSGTGLTLRRNIKKSMSNADARYRSFFTILHERQSSHTGGNVAGFDGVIIGRASGHPGGSGPVTFRREGARATVGNPGAAAHGLRGQELWWSE